MSNEEIKELKRLIERTKNAKEGSIQWYEDLQFVSYVTPSRLEALISRLEEAEYNKETFGSCPCPNCGECCCRDPHCVNK